MKNGVTQDDIAKAVGVSQPTVARWLRGAAIGGEDLLNLARYFSVSPFVLMGSEPLSAAALREAPPDYHVDDLLAEMDKLKEQMRAVERAAQRLKKSKP